MFSCIRKVLLNQECSPVSGRFSWIRNVLLNQECSPVSGMFSWIRNVLLNQECSPESGMFSCIRKVLLYQEGSPVPSRCIWARCSRWTMTSSPHTRGWWSRCRGSASCPGGGPRPASPAPSPVGCLSARRVGPPACCTLWLHSRLWLSTGSPWDMPDIFSDNMWCQRETLVSVLGGQGVEKDVFHRWISSRRKSISWAWISYFFPPAKDRLKQSVMSLSRDTHTDTHTHTHTQRKTGSNCFYHTVKIRPPNSQNKIRGGGLITDLLHVYSDIKKQGHCVAC